jgi:uncharacterized membrane protein
MIGRAAGHMDELGPIQVMVVAFDEIGQLRRKILEELKRLEDDSAIRLVDLLIVKRDHAGKLEILQRSNLTADGPTTFGAILGSLFGATESESGEDAGGGAPDGVVEDEEPDFGGADVWYLADTVPRGMAAAVALLEHRWAVPLRGAILDAGGSIAAVEWIHPADLVAAAGAYAAVARLTSERPGGPGTPT